MKRQLFRLLILLFPFVAGAQGTSPDDPVIIPAPQVYYAFTNARIFIDPDHTIQGTLLIRNGKVIEAGQQVKIPAGTVVRDLQGAYIYPSFIDPFSVEGIQVKNKPDKRGPVYERKDQRAGYWNEAIRPRQDAASQITLDKELLSRYRAAGFSMLNIHVPDGIVRGTSTIVLTGNDALPKNLVLAPAALHFSLDKGSSGMDYPSSQMGSIALLRQTLLDAKWYHMAPPATREVNLDLEALNTYLKLPAVFEVKDKLEIFRAAKIGSEAGIDFIIAGSGNEYQRADEIKATGVRLIIPAELPKPFDVEDPFNAELVSLAQMKHWELAPHNPRILHAKGIPFAFTAKGMKDPSEFLVSLRKMVAAGLASRDALSAITTRPAEMLGISHLAGSLSPGKLANFIIASDSMFKEKTIILEHWVEGKGYPVQRVELADIRGTYDLNVNRTWLYQLFVSGERFQPVAKAVVTGQRDTFPVNLQAVPELISMHFPTNKGYIRLSGKVNYKSGIWDGKAQLSDGQWVDWSAIKKAPFKKPVDTLKKQAVKKIHGALPYPFTAYGDTSRPDSSMILIRNITIWTSDSAGILNNHDVLISKGKISRIGRQLDVSKIREPLRVIDGTGKHLTPGIIDEHSHIAISKGVNESGQSISAEVRIGDVVNSEDINIYRQLAGGVTTAQLLHGSANPVGGQSALIKLRWGKTPDQMLIKDADGFIKFALGENVKQANWGENYSSRFPQTRMGVEQVFYNGFFRAREYMAAWDKYNNLSPKEREKQNVTPPRRDLELEAMAEILRNERFITCHSYVQSEINMLMHVADSLGFTINTFTHILEGYKVADKMKEHGAGASTFSDWWAYKFEVTDAIPYNAALLHEMGIVTAINSDDAEMGRRLNQEAAKTVKYGGVSETDALKMITINPAKLLHIDDRTGSITVGKDADVVIWNTHPLSVYAMAEKTIADGIIYYDRAQEQEKRKWVEAERARLISLMIAAKEKGEKTRQPEPEKQNDYHCDTLEP